MDRKQKVVTAGFAAVAESLIAAAMNSMLADNPDGWDALYKLDDAIDYLKHARASLAGKEIW